MIEIAASDLADCVGIGVAGNFAGHLDQAGEADDFVAVEATGDAPKGIFPWYLPGAGGQLGEFPLSSDRLTLPTTAGDRQLDVQIEPEAGVLCDLSYENGVVVAVTPRALGAFNDCSVRRDGAAKISEKKNWGAASKGFATRCFAVGEIDADGACAELRLACFLLRDGRCIEYGVDSPLPGYSYFGAKLLGWIADRLESQRSGGPLEDVGAQLQTCAQPARALIAIGATRYSDFGESHFLLPGDRSVVVIYDSKIHSGAEIATAIGTGATLEAASILNQTVTPQTD